MKLMAPTHVGHVTGTCCRQSPIRGLVGALTVSAALIGFVVFLRHRGVPTIAWGGCAAVAGLLSAWFLTDACAKFRSANWLLWLGPDGLWINLRSYQNRHLPEAATILHFPYREIGSARRHFQTWSTPANPHSTAGTHWKEESLELTVTHRETAEIARALADERDRRATIRGTHQAVTVPAYGVIRIAWCGHGNDVVPSLARVLDELSQRVPVHEPTRVDRPDWCKLSEAELDELVAALVRSGDHLEAGQLLIRRRGLSETESHAYVEEQARRI